MTARAFAKPLAAVDRVEWHPRDGGWSVTALKTVSRTDPYLAGHYPGLTLYPAVFLIETVRQAVGTALRDTWGDWLEVASLRDLRLRKPMLDGDRLTLSIDVVPDDTRLRVRARVVRPDGAMVAALAVELAGAGAASAEPAPAEPAPAEAPAEPAPAEAPAAIDYPRVLELIPVRNPMLLVDRVEAVVPGVRIETAKAISGSEPCYAGLPDGLPHDRYAFPRSLVIESFGQSSALLWLAGEQRPGGEVDWLPMAGRMRHGRFFGSGFPGDVIRHTVYLKAIADGTTAFLSGRSRIADRVVFTVDSLVAVRRPRASVLER